MTTTQTDTLVLKDEAGEYYLLPQDALEQCRVSGKRKAEIERLVNDSDVSGHVLWAYFLYRFVRDATK